MTNENEEYELVAASLNYIGRLKPKGIKSPKNICIGPLMPIYKEEAPKTPVIKTDNKKTG